MSPIKKLTPLQSILLILVSTFFCSGVPFFLWHYSFRLQQNRKLEEVYFIREIIQIGPLKEALKTKHLAELLHLSKNHPTNLYQFDLQKGEQNLLSSGIIKEAKLLRTPPHTLTVEYSIREPIAYLSDYSNLVLDHEGSIFPLSPYLTPKKLVEFYLGIRISPFQYGKIVTEKMATALELYDLLSPLDKKGLHLLKIDLSQMEAYSLGRREMVVTLEEELNARLYLRYLRLTKENYREEISHFLNLKGFHLDKSLIIDLRMSPDAYLSAI